MAYAEKRGKTIRARFKLPDGRWDQSAVDDDGNPFRTMQDAENWGNDQEAAMRAGTWRDPRKGEMTVAAWIAMWQEGQDLADGTLERYRYHVDTHILPAFGERPLASLVYRHEIDAWEKKIRNTISPMTGKLYSPTTAANARTILRMILGDAINPAKLIDTNVAERPRNRGRMSSRRNVVAKSARSRKVVATPLQALLCAERVAILTGWGSDFVLIILIAWTGMRWGEAIGLEPGDIDGNGRLRLDWQLSEINGRFKKAIPKDNSVRPIDLPPFLLELVGATGRKCRCKSGACIVERDQGRGVYLFLTKSGAHHRRSNFNRRAWRPAADGHYPEERGAARSVDARPVLVASDGLHGARVLPVWPMAEEGKAWAPPSGRGWPLRHGLDEDGRIEALENLPLASWLAVLRDLEIHGLRHSHQTLMADARISKALRAERLGHTPRGIQEAYEHPSEDMRRQLEQLLERLWAEALAERAELDVRAGRVPCSSVGVLDDLLAPHREKLASKVVEIAPEDRLPKVSQTGEAALS